MIKVTINGEALNFPTSWDEVTFDQYLKIISSKSKAELMCILLNQDYDAIKNKTVTGLEGIFIAMSFTDKPAKFDLYYPKIGPYTLPRNNNKSNDFDIRFESLGQFEDMRSVMGKIDPNEILSLLKAYGKSVAIYLQKIRDKEYDYSKIHELEDEIKTYPACEVIGLGQFFFLKLIRLLNGTKETSPTTAPSRRNSKPVSKSSKRPLASTRR